MTEPGGRDVRVAVAIPCHDEAGAIASVIDEWRRALPTADLVVFDNRSTDGTGDLARGLGVRVVEVRQLGKGYAVRAAFAALRDYDAVVLVDGDGTYPADHVGALLAPVLSGTADTAVGARRPEAVAGAMTPIRGLGNLLIRLTFRVLIGPGGGDLLSGYRVFGPEFLRSVVPRSRGFEIEAELASEAVCRGLRGFESPVPYRPRVVGTVSKLRAWRDGRRIVRAILGQSLRLRPWRPAGLAALLTASAWLALRAWRQAGGSGP